VPLSNDQSGVLQDLRKPLSTLQGTSELAVVAKDRVEALILAASKSLCGRSVNG